MNDETVVKIMVICFFCVIIGGIAGSYYQSFNIPTMKIWDSKRTYDKILLADNVMCVPANEMNASYWNYETVVYNKTEYVFKKRQVGNESAKGVIVCT